MALSPGVVDCHCRSCLDKEGDFVVRCGHAANRYFVKTSRSQAVSVSELASR
jgi:hypothetical protein